LANAASRRCSTRPAWSTVSLEVHDPFDGAVLNPTLRQIEVVEPVEGRVALISAWRGRDVGRRIRCRVVDKPVDEVIGEGGRSVYSIRPAFNFPTKIACFVEAEVHIQRRE